MISDNIEHIFSVRTPRVEVWEHENQLLPRFRVFTNSNCEIQWIKPRATGHLGSRLLSRTPKGTEKRFEVAGAPADSKWL